MPQTSNGANSLEIEVTTMPAYREGVCNAIRKDDKPCAAAAQPGTLRCKFHPIDKYPASYALPPAPNADKPAAPSEAAPAVVIHDPEFRLDAASQLEALAEMMSGDNEQPPAVRVVPAGPVPQAAAAAEPETEAVPEGYERRPVYDSEADDYVFKLVPIQTALAYASDPDVHHDGFELGPAYYEGENAAFDYRFINDDPKQNLTDRKNGFVPVKKALDNRFRVEGGVVKFGDLILARRPKEITEQRAREMVRTHERVTGEAQAFQQEGVRNGVQTFGSVTGEGIDGEYEERAAQTRLRQEERQPKPRGGKSYAFPNNPIGRDLVAERHGSVGG